MRRVCSVICRVVADWGHAMNRVFDASGVHNAAALRSALGAAEGTAGWASEWVPLVKVVVTADALGRECAARR